MWKTYAFISGLCLFFLAVIFIFSGMIGAGVMFWINVFS